MPDCDTNRDNKKGREMNNLQIFKSPDFGQVRIIQQNGEPWFIGKDVAEILGYKKPENAIAVHVDDEDKTTTLIQGTGSNYKSNAVIINESGLYSLILSSKMPKAKEFKRWVTSEVLPAIRKHGAYMNDDVLKQAIQSPDFLIKLATELKEEKEARRQAEANLQAAKPKVLFADAVSASDSTILIGDLAKILKQNGYNTGQKRLFQWLRDNGYLIKRQGADYNSPTQRSMELGLFRVKETPIIHADGHVTVNKTVKVTPKAQIYFANKFLGGKCSEGFE